MTTHASAVPGYTLNSNQAEHHRLRTQSENLRAHSSALLAPIALPPGARAIDVGCGPGGTLDLLAEKVGPDGRVVGVEIDGASVARARAFARERRLTNVEIVTADARHTELPESSFDLVHARLLLANIPAPGQVVAEMARLVRPGGWVALMEPDIALSACYPPHPGLEHMTELLVTAYRHEGADPHIGRRLPHLLATAGLETIETEARAEVCPPNHAQRVVILNLANNMRAKILARGLIGEPELEKLDRDARLHLDNPATLSLPVTYFLVRASKVR